MLCFSFAVYLALDYYYHFIITVNVIIIIIVIIFLLIIIIIIIIIIIVVSIRKSKMILAPLSTPLCGLYKKSE